MAFLKRKLPKKLPVSRLIMPADLRECSNGELPASLLRKISPSGKMHHLAAQSWAVLQELAEEEGFKLVHVGDYRPYSQQLSLFKSRMKPYPNAKKDKQTVRTFEDAKWYLHNGAPVATPGTSNHGWGLAIDVAVKGKIGVVSVSTKFKPSGKSALDFLLREAQSLGWSWELQSEPWHIRYVAGDKIPVRLEELLSKKA